MLVVILLVTVEVMTVVVVVDVVIVALASTVTVEVVGAVDVIVGFGANFMGRCLGGLFIVVGIKVSTSL